jgi:uncharacterized protein
MAAASRATAAAYFWTEPPMKLHLDRTSNLNLITGYQPGQVAINDTPYTTSLVVLPTRLIVAEWQVESFEALSEAHFRLLAGLDLEVLIFGSGAALRFPHPRLTACLLEARIGLEVMDTGAACRTYNILVADQRRVAAALLPP